MCAPSPDACHWPILAVSRLLAALLVCGWRKDGGLTNLWLEARGFVYPFVYQGYKALKTKGYLLITNQPLYQLS